jgi:hypothetical protein
LGINGYGLGIAASYDHGVFDYISVGVGGAFYFSPNTNNANFFLYGRGNLHLNDLLNMGDKWNVYPGLNLGFL